MCIRNRKVNKSETNMLMSHANIRNVVNISKTFSRIVQVEFSVLVYLTWTVLEKASCVKSQNEAVEILQWKSMDVHDFSIVTDRNKSLFWE